MTNSPRRTPVARAGATPAGRRRLRRALAAAAGVGRRTFFRYFDAKDDVLFANHDEIVAEMEEFFAEADPAREPVEVACAGVGLVLDSYAAELDVSLNRFALTRAVPSLRDKEVATVDRYQRVLARYLRERFEELGAEAASLRAAVAAAAIAAANNHVLRRWLRSGGKDDIKASAAAAFALVIDAFRTGAPPSAVEEKTVVAVLTSSAPLQEVVAQVSAALRAGDHREGVD
jgi:AcrR family transcriptional regulator